MKLISAVLSLGSLAACLAVPVMYLRGELSETAYKQILTAVSLIWFAAATTWATRRGRGGAAS